MTTSNSTVRTVRHPLALDECRAKCQPYLWNGPDGMDWEVGRHAEEVGGGGKKTMSYNRRDVMFPLTSRRYVKVVFGCRLSGFDIP